MFWLIVLLGAIALVIALVWVYRVIIYPSDSREGDRRNNDPVVILSGATELEAQVARGKLESLGLKAYIRNSISPTIEYVPVYGWEVMVRYADRIEAARCLGLPDSEGTAAQ
jgi:hypothetical protein